MEVAQVGKVYAQLDPPLWLVTAADGGRRGGLIATTVAQASIVKEMPRQLITVDKRHNTHTLIEGSGAFAMHLIDERQLDLVWRFGLQSCRDVDKFAGLTFRTGTTGSPLIAEALGWFMARNRRVRPFSVRTGDVATHSSRKRLPHCTAPDGFPITRSRAEFTP
jgi:flavin reductase (DIM6/NTAB) family NADH-FMN oxidoreductase RutF